jgi:hypothetical protein
MITAFMFGKQRRRERQSSRIILEGSELDCGNRLANHLKGLDVEEKAGSTPGEGCADATLALEDGSTNSS